MTDLNTRILFALFDLAQADESADESRLCSWLAVTHADLCPVLDHLAVRGLVDRERVRLTMRGLATAVRLGARAHRSVSEVVAA